MYKLSSQVTRAKLPSSVSISHQNRPKLPMPKKSVNPTSEATSGTPGTPWQGFRNPRKNFNEFTRGGRGRRDIISHLIQKNIVIRNCFYIYLC